jgi:hypothetical protein
MCVRATDVQQHLSKGRRTVGKSMMLICWGKVSDTVAVLQVLLQEYVRHQTGLDAYPKQTILHESMQAKHLQELSEVWVTRDYEAVGNRNEAMRQGCSKKVPRAGTTHALGAHRLQYALKCL